MYELVLTVLLVTNNVNAPDVEKVLSETVLSNYDTLENCASAIRGTTWSPWREMDRGFNPVADKHAAVVLNCVRTGE